MKFKKLLINLYFFLLSIILGYCKDDFNYECEHNSNNVKSDISYSYLLNNYSPIYSNKVKPNFFPEQINATINPGEVHSISLFIDNMYTFNISPNFNSSNDLSIHFYPLDCQIEIIKEDDMIIERISNYEYDAYYAKIQGNKLNSTHFKIRTLINSVNDYKKKRTFHLKINSFDIKSPNLKLKEKEPTLLSFKNGFDKINLTYDLIQKEYPISISFFIKERVKFHINVTNAENISLKNKTVYYKDIIVIETYKNSSKINIAIEKKEKEKEAVIIVKVIGDYTTPIYLQKNILNLGFIPSKITNQYYYLEVFKGEYGEIVLNNKKYNGILISKIISKTEGLEKKINSSSEIYPKQEIEDLEDTNIGAEFLEYNEYSQKISFNSDKTKLCEENGCYLLVTYQSIYLENAHNSIITGTEFSLLGRIMEDEEEFKSQIINIPLNEYILGSFESSSFNIHYYSIYIPDKTKNLTLEINVNNIAIYVKKEVKPINIYNIKYFTMKYFGNFVEVINPQDYKFNSIEDPYITIALIIYLPLENSHYYFRVLQEYSNNDYIIYPLDTNKANICNTTKTKEGNYSCFFLIDNTYKDLNNNLILYAYGYNYINNIHLFEEKGENDSYSMDMEDLNYTIISDNDNRYFKIENDESSNFIVIEIQSPQKETETLTILASFDINTFVFPPIQIYSYQLVYLNDYKNFSIYFEHNSTNNFRILINNTHGDGEIKFGSNSSLNKYNSLISGNRILSFVIQKDMNNITIYNKNYYYSPLVFSIKVVYELKNQILEELYFNNVYKLVTKPPPIQYFLKEIQYEGADINFYFKNRYLTEDSLIIRGYILKYDLMKLISDRTFLQLDFGPEIKGKFDSRTNIGLLTFDIVKDSEHYDYYYLIEIESNKTIPQITLDIFATSKNASQFSMPINTYISGSFDLTKGPIQMQRYYINDAQDSSSDEFIVEFSSNYINININFSDFITLNSSMNNGGIRKFLVNITKDYKENNYFDIIVNKTTQGMGDNYCLSANYIIRYYQSDVKWINYKTNLKAELQKNVDDYTITIRNEAQGNISGIYGITCIFNIYEKDTILLDESINTIALIQSKSQHREIKSYSEAFTNTSFNLSNIKDDEEYKGNVFIIFRNKSYEDQISYYSFEFNIKNPDRSNPDNDDHEKRDRIIGLIFAIVFVLIIIAAIICIVKYRKMVKKNKTLEQRVNEISFSSEGLKEEEDEGGRITFV